MENKTIKVTLVKDYDFYNTGQYREYYIDEKGAIMLVHALIGVEIVRSIQVGLR
ncbi:MAG: hypothetical protein FWC41_11610 [Firmicutes bacterium]|nr:hypothetical protein [Bacillota bacterium]